MIKIYEINGEKFIKASDLSENEKLKEAFGNEFALDAITEVLDVVENFDSYFNKIFIAISILCGLTALLALKILLS